MAISSLPNNAFPLPAPLTPTLLALGLDHRTAAALSKVYLSSALTLKATCEAEYIRACAALLAASDDRGYSSKELRSKLLTVAITRYMQALSKWADEATGRAEATLLQQGRKIALKHKVITLPSEPSRKANPRRLSGEGSANTVIVAKPTSFGTTSPSHAFPRAYPPPVRPEPIPFVTHIPLLEKRTKLESKTASDCDLDACIDALSRLSLGPPSPRGRSSRKPSKPASKPRSKAHTTSNPKPTSQLSPSRPRLVSPMVDTSVAVPHKPLPKSIPSSPSPSNIPRTQNIDIPRSDRRKICSIPYRRPTLHLSTSPESPSSSPLSRSIHRTPSLVSDHGSEASSPSTPPDFPSMPIPPSVLPRKGSLPDAMSLFGHFPVRYPDGGHVIDFGTDIYG